MVTIEIYRAADRVFLNRRSPDGTTTGIFECRIRTDSSLTEYRIFYIGVYDAGAGKLSLTTLVLFYTTTPYCTINDIDCYRL